MLCKSCGQPVPNGSEFCNHCGAPVGHTAKPPLMPISPLLNPDLPPGRSWGLLVGVIGLVLVFVLFVIFVTDKGADKPTQGTLINSTADSSTRDTTSSVNTTEEPKLFHEAALANVKLVRYSWYTDELVPIMKANFTIRNNNEVPVKDLEVTCWHSAASGTLIDHNTRTIYEVIGSHATRSFRDFNMGFIHSQAARSACSVTDLALMDSLTDKKIGPKTENPN